MGEHCKQRTQLKFFRCLALLVAMIRMFPLYLFTSTVWPLVASKVNKIIKRFVVRVEYELNDFSI